MSERDSKNALIGLLILLVYGAVSYAIGYYFGSSRVDEERQSQINTINAELIEMGVKRYNPVTGQLEYNKEKDDG